MSEEQHFSETEKEAFRKRVRDLLDEGRAFSGQRQAVELRTTSFLTGDLHNLCSYAQSTGGASSIVKIEKNLTYEMESVLIEMGMSPRWRDGIRGLKSLGASLKMKGDKLSETSLKALATALHLNSQVAFVTGTGALMLPHVRSFDVTGEFKNGAHVKEEALTGNYTPIWTLAEALAATVSDLQMYFGSLMGAKVLGGLANREFVPASSVKVVLWDFRKEIAERVFLPDVDTDGGALATTNLLSAPGVQFRGFSLLNTQEGGVIWKGAMHEHPVHWSEVLKRPVVKHSCSDEEWDASCPVVLFDANCPKGKGKKSLLRQLQDEGHVVMNNDTTQLWSISHWGRGDWYGEDCIKLPLSFQDGVFLPSDEDWKSEVERCIHKLFRPRSQKIGGVEMPTLDSTRARQVERLISGSSLRRARQLRARANRFVPFGAVMVHPRVLNREDAERKSFGWVAQGRAPTVQMHSKQCNIAFTPLGLEEMLRGLHRKALCEILERHNSRARWFFGSDAKDHILDEKGLIERLALLERSTRGVDLRGSFLANQLDASCREEDQDGDTTVCESGRWWTRLFGNAQTYWSGANGIPPIKLELPKAAALNWAGIEVENYLGHPHAKGVTPALYAERFLTMSQWAFTWFQEAIADPQGPTGLWSDLAADIFARIPFFRSGATAKDIMEQYQGQFKAWLAAAFGIQTSIDWQKRAYPCPGFTLALADKLSKGEAVTVEELWQLFERAFADEEIDPSNLCWDPRSVNGKGSHGFCPETQAAKELPDGLIEEIVRAVEDSK